MGIDFSAKLLPKFFFRKRYAYTQFQFTNNFIRKKIIGKNAKNGFGEFL